MKTETAERNQERVSQVKLILRRLIAEVETAEAEADDTDWLDEKADIIESALNSVGWRCQNLGYDLLHSSGSLLTKREQA